MKSLATLALLLVLAAPVSAGVVWDESVNGDLSTDPATPTPLVFSPGGNVITGTVRLSNGTGGDRDFITFNVPPGGTLTGLNLLAWAPDFTGFIAFNGGTTSWVPDLTTDPNFLAGIHVAGYLTGFDLLPLFVTDAVTSNSLPSAELGPGDYCFVVQQTGSALQAYSFDFVLDAPVPTANPTWGAIKQLYR